MQNKSYFLYITTFLTLFFIVPVSAQTPSYTLELRNDAQVSATEYEFDIYLLRTGTDQFEYAQGQFGILVNPDIINGGSIAVSVVSGSVDPVLTVTNQAPKSIDFFEAANAIRIAPPSPPGAGNGATISSVLPGTRVCRVRLSNTVAFGQYQPNLTLTTTTIYPTQVYAYVDGNNTAITSFPNHTTNNLSNPVLNVITSISNNYDEEDLKVYPNPFRERINIEYLLLSKSHVRLSVLSIDGKLIYNLVDEDQQAGNYSLYWDAFNQPGGTYLLRLQSGLTQKTFKITLSR